MDKFLKDEETYIQQYKGILKEYGDKIPENKQRFLKKLRSYYKISDERAQQLEAMLNPKLRAKTSSSWTATMKNKRNFKEEADVALAKAIEECNKVAKNSAKGADKEVSFIRNSIDKANKEIESCINDISAQEIRDNDSLIQLKDRLREMKTASEKVYDDVEALVKRKTKEATKFNITLFGRTKVGKSTLMEILTNGDGQSIGKGGQRTTLDVRQYEWRGLTITDVPGIDAFDGEVDEKIAYEAAKTADIILFMISDGQPEKTEADWLVRLKREDKPMICLCNAKRSLNDEKDKEMFLDNPDNVLNNNRIKEIIEQFNNFVKEQLPNEHIDIIITQLQARFLANKPEYASNRKALINASRFNRVENEIRRIVINDGISFRRKCFFSIIDNALYTQSLELIESSSAAYQQSLIVNEKMQEFNNWRNEVAKEEWNSLLKHVDQLFEDVIAELPSFVEDNLERQDFKALYERFLNSKRLKEEVQACYDHSVEKVKKKVDDIFRSLNVELQLQRKLLSEIDTNVQGTKIHNWKRIGEWGGLITSATVGILVMVGAIAAPVAFVVGLIGAIGWGLFSWLSDSREDKLHRERIRVEKQLKKGIIKSKKETKDNVYKLFLTKIWNGIIEESGNRLYIIRKTLLTLTNSQRELGLRYLQHHTDISKRIVQSALFDLGVSGKVSDQIDFVARIPGKKTVIGYSADDSIRNLTEKISEKIGNKEEVRIFNKKLSGDLENQLTTLCSYFKLNIRIKVKTINNDGFEHNVVFISNSNDHTSEMETNIQLIQQILNVHFIKR